MLPFLPARFFFLQSWTRCDANCVQEYARSSTREWFANRAIMIAIAEIVNGGDSWNRSDPTITSNGSWHPPDQSLAHRRADETEQRDSSSPSLSLLAALSDKPRSLSRWAYTLMYTVIQLQRAVIIHPGVSRSPSYCPELIKLRITAGDRIIFPQFPSQICAGAVAVDFCTFCNF